MKKLIERLKNNAGSTLTEMIVCFALLGIFMAAAATFISTITNLYYEIKGETYSRQVSDIILQKVESELDGAKYDENFEMEAPNPVVNSDYTSMSLYDKTDTLVTIETVPKSGTDTTKNKLVVSYAAINYVDKDDDTNSFSRNANDWYFDDEVYNGFSITSMYMIPANKLDDAEDEGVVTLSDYGIISGASNNYEKNVVVILLSINSSKYGTYNTYRFVKMYNLPNDYWNITSSGA